jgi:hypothetical protein
MNMNGPSGGWRVKVTRALICTRSENQKQKLLGTHAHFEPTKAGGWGEERIHLEGNYPAKRFSALMGLSSPPSTISLFVPFQKEANKYCYDFCQ